MPGSQFTYIDFGPTCNAFLSACGVKDEPTPMELAQLMVKTPQDFLNAQGVEGYLSLLRQLAAHYALLKTNRTLLSDMKSKPFLIGIKSADSVTKDGRADGAANNSGTQYKLARSQDIYLIDDTVLGQLFNPLGYVLNYEILPKVPLLKPLLKECMKILDVFGFLNKLKKSPPQWEINLRRRNHKSSRQSSMIEPRFYYTMANSFATAKMCFQMQKNIYKISKCSKFLSLKYRVSLEASRRSKKRLRASWRVE